MRLKSLLFVCCLGSISAAFAGGQHFHPSVTANESTANASTKSAMTPGYCQIEITNTSYSDVIVTGQYDDGTLLQPFTVHSFDRDPDEINLNFGGYCHPYVYLEIITVNDNYTVYSGRTNAGSTIHITPYLANQVKATVSMK